MKLKIDLLPKGAWGNDLSKTLRNKDWNKIKNICYKRANGSCEICGAKTFDLNAHEIWNFDINKETQTLVGIIAICDKCHGVIHFKNSVRSGYGECAKQHFMSVNNCSETVFAKCVIEAKQEYEKRNHVLRWKQDANLKKFAGVDIEMKKRNIPIIGNPYKSVDWQTAHYSEQQQLFEITENDGYLKAPYVMSIETDNYNGIITIEACGMRRVKWFLNGEQIKTQYCLKGNRVVEFSVENLACGELYFVIEGEGVGSLKSKIYTLSEYSNFCK